MKKFAASTLRELKNAPTLHNNDSIDINTFYNYYGTQSDSRRINDEVLIKKASWWDKLLRRK